jgi:hypothetical protein
MVYQKQTSFPPRMSLEKWCEWMSKSYLWSI